MGKSHENHECLCWFEANEITKIFELIDLKNRYQLNHAA